MAYLSAIVGLPLALGLLSVGIGLLVRHLSGGWLPVALTAPVGLAGLVCLGQGFTAFSGIAPALVVAAPAAAGAGLWLQRGEVRAAAGVLRRSPWALVAVTVAYLIAVAPVLMAGRATLAAYLLDSTAGVQLSGADRIVDHGRDFASLPESSYRLYLEAYFGNQYPSGAHVALGLIGKFLPANLMWLYTPFLGSMLAFCVPSAWWLLRRRFGAAAPLAAAGSVLVALPALVYAYALMGAIKEITLLPVVLVLLAIVMLWRRWLGGPVAAVLPVAVVAGAGLGIIGLAFGAWITVAAAILLVAAGALIRRDHGRVRPIALQIAAVVPLLVVLALPTVRDLASSLTLATSLSQSNAAAANDPGNLLQPIRWIQSFGVWLGGTHRVYPNEHFWATLSLIAVVALAACFGLIALVRRRQWSGLAFLGGAGVIWWALTDRGTVWTDAKLVVISSPLILLLAAGGVSELAATRRRAEAAVLLAVVGFGVLASDALLYHDTNLAPTERFEEQADINSRFAGQGPALLTDFDEYALFTLRDLDPAGPGFARKPSMLATNRNGDGFAYGTTVDLDELATRTVAAYPLIVMRRSPERSLPPMGYELAWRGSSYEVWRRTDTLQRVRVHRPAQEPGRATAKLPCGAIDQLSAADGAEFAISTRARTVVGDPASADRSGAWVASPAGGLGIVGPGRLVFEMNVPRSGPYRLWVKGDFNRPIDISIDDRRVGSVGYDTGGQGNYATPLDVTMESGERRIELERGGGTLAPGNGGGSRIGLLVLEPAWDEAQPRREIISKAELESLCRGPLDWVEALAPAR